MTVLMVVATLFLLIARRPALTRRVAHPAALQYASIVIWLLVLSGLYSSTANWWIPGAPSWVLDIFRFAQLALRTGVLVIMVTLLYWAVKTFRQR